MTQKNILYEGLNLKTPAYNYKSSSLLKTPRPTLKNGIHKFIYNTGLRGGKLQKLYKLKLKSQYYCEYYKDDRNIMLTFNRIEVRNGKVALCQ